jgi:hypothetical protein
VSDKGNERAWRIHGEIVDPYALERVKPNTEPHAFVAGNHVTGCTKCGTSRANPVHTRSGS